jgi:hypothetical protein
VTGRETDGDGRIPDSDSWNVSQASPGEPWPTIRSALVERKTIELMGPRNVERSIFLRKATAGRLSKVEFRKVAVLRRCSPFTKLIFDALSHL